MVSDLNKAENLSTTNNVSAKNHLFRSIILLDYIIQDPKWKGKLKELLRLREVIASLIVDQEPFAKLQQTIDAAIQLDVNAYKAFQKNPG